MSKSYQQQTPLSSLLFNIDKETLRKKDNDVSSPRHRVMTQGRTRSIIRARSMISPEHASPNVAAEENVLLIALARGMRDKDAEVHALMDVTKHAGQSLAKVNEIMPTPVLRGEGRWRKRRGTSKRSWRRREEKEKKRKRETRNKERWRKEQKPDRKEEEEEEELRRSFCPRGCFVSPMSNYIAN